LTIWLAEEVLAAWRPAERPNRMGRTPIYSDLAISVMLTLQAVYNLALRQTQGLMESLVELLEVDLPVPNYSTLSRRRPHLQVELPRQNRSEGLHLVVDSTGLKLYGEGEWKVRMHGVSKRRTWRKVHLGIDEATSEVLACVVTEQKASDHWTLPQLLKQVPERLEKVGGDKGYDYGMAYELISQRGAEPVILPKQNAAVAPFTNFEPRNRVVRRIKEVGRDEWKQESGYHRRSLVETGMFRLKTVFGDRLRSRATLRDQQVEVRIRCAALNRMTHLGMPRSVKVAA
jgi:hypothetical protein